MKIVWCPKCQATQNVNITITENIEKDKDGKDNKTITESYQCSVCHMFVNSKIIQMKETIE